MKNLIEIKNVCKNYYTGDNEIIALKNLDLQVSLGEFISIVGASGSGKSTLMNCLGCLDTFDSGEYFLDGIDITKQSDNELSLIRNRKIGFIFQGFNLIKGLTALENVELPLIYRGMKRQKAKEIAAASLDRVKLLDRLSHKPSQMSGGQQQRVAIARAIAAKPQIILADEPTGNLDVISAKAIMDILNELNIEGKTIVLITHDKNIADMAQRKIVFN